MIFQFRIKQDLQTYVVVAAAFTAFCSGSSAAASVAASALGSTASGSVAIATSVRSFWDVEVHVGLALPDRLDYGCLSTSASHEVEFCILEQVLELLTRLPLNLHVGDVLRRKLVGSLCTLGGEQDREVAQVAQSDLLAFEQHLSHAVHCHVEDGADVGSGIYAAVRSDVLGKL